MSRKDEAEHGLSGTISIPEDLIREFYRAAAMGGIIAHEGTDRMESALSRAFTIAEEAMKLRKTLDE